MSFPPLLELFDSYSRQARLFPGLLTIFPPMLALFAWFPELLLSSIGATLLTVFTSCGLLYFLASLARTRGKATEKRLLVKWGGWPTTMLLRRSNSRLDIHTRARYYQFFERHVPGLHIPTADEELGDPAAADQVYGSAVNWLKEKTRKEKFWLVEKENAQYGFRRNLRGMKPIGIVGCILTILFALFALLLRHPTLLSALLDGTYSEAMSQVRVLQPAALAALGVNILALCAWLFLVRDAWVEEAGYQYAAALLSSCDKISQK